MPDPEAAKSITTFLFDLDGTLVDSATDLATSVNLLRQEHDLPPLDLDTVRSYVGDGATMLIRRAMPEGEFKVGAVASVPRTLLSAPGRGHLPLSRNH